MAFAAGTRLGPYEILSPLGAGGMGEVYRARDTRLDRTVAVKVVASAIATDPDSRVRFEREARAVALLDHPHICAVYDVGQHDDVHYLVMQYLEGETLAARLARSSEPLPLYEILTIGSQLADGLDRTHRAGVTHRDLKPSNVMLTKSGARAAGLHAKLMDFGLAKLRGTTGLTARADVTQVATSSPSTAVGTLVGTVHYMAPEQVEGREADARSDIWALGVLLYEMATGRRPFGGESAASIIGAILKDTPPPVCDRRPQVPRAFSHIVERCLAKDPDERWQSAADVAGELRWLATTGDEAAAASAPETTRPWERLMWIAVTIALVAALGVLVRRPSDHAAVSGVAPVAFSIHPPEGGTFGSPLASVPTPQFAVSPDGRQIAYVAAESDGIARLWLRPLDADEGRVLAGTEDAAYPFWSPDNRTVAFFAQRALKKVDVGGGPPQEISPATINMRGGAWSTSGTIVFNPDTEVGLLRVSSAGGTPAPLLLAGKSWSGVARWPHFVDDTHFLIQLRDDTEGRTIYIGSVEDAAITKLVTSDWSAQASQGFLLFLNGTTLMAQPFASDGLSLTGEAIPLRSDVAGATTGYGAFSASRTGVLAYAKAARTLGELRWFDRTGTPHERAAPAADYSDFRLSPDGARLAYSRVDPLTQAPDIWVLDLRRGGLERKTSHPLTEASALWSPTGDRLLYRSNRGSTNNQLYVTTVGAAVTEPELVVSDAMLKAAQHSNAIPSDWSADGAWVAYSASTTKTGFDVWALPITGDRKPVLVAQSPFNEMQGVISPDSHWIAYASDQSGRYEVYVQAFPVGKETWTISKDGGSQPRWSRQGRELMYLRPDGMLMSAATQVGQTFAHSPATALFKTALPTVVNPYRWGYVPSADGERILLAVPEQGSAKPAITVVTNWQALLKR